MPAAQPQAMAATQPPQAQQVKPNEHMQRLQDIEQHVIGAVEIASSVMEELANLGPQIDQDKVKQLCTDFMAKMQAAQELVAAGGANPVIDRGFKHAAYPQMNRAYMAHEKVLAVSLQVNNMLQLLKQKTQRPPLADEPLALPAPADQAAAQGMEDVEFEDV